MIVTMRVMFLVLAACGGRAAEPVLANTTPEPDDVIIKLARTECLGYCPVYTVTITEKGRVRYTGSDWVKTKSGETRLGIETLENLVFQFKAQKFETLPSNMEGTTTDVPHLFLTYRGKEIHYSATVVVLGSPEAMQRYKVDRLADEVDKAVNIDQFIGTDKERDELAKKARLERARKICDRKTGQARVECYDDQAVPMPP
jgi:hypothetical protein